MNFDNSLAKRLAGLAKWREEVAKGLRPAKRDANVLRRIITEEAYGACAAHRRKRLVVTLEKGDVLRLREQRRGVSYTVRLYDVYTWLIRSAAQAETARKLKVKKDRKAQALADARQTRAERRLFR